MFSSAFIERLRSATSVAVLTGAGASAESGIPTFRDPGGLWDQVDPTEMASLRGFRANPIRVQSWYSARRANVLKAQPHAGHLALAELEALVPVLTLVTQNVDGLHERAGSRDVIEIHGSLMRTVCLSCGSECGPLDVAPDAAEPQVCTCGGLVRPTVVWFGENLDRTLFERAWLASANCDIFLSVGTGADVQPAASLPIAAMDQGAFVVEINPHRTAISDRVHERIEHSAGVALPQLVRLFEPVN